MRRNVELTFASSAVACAEAFCDQASESWPGSFAASNWKATMLRTGKIVGDVDLASVQALAADLRDTIDASDEALVSVDCSDAAERDV